MWNKYKCYGGTINMPLSTLYNIETSSGIINMPLSTLYNIETSSGTITTSLTCGAFRLHAFRLSRYLKSSALTFYDIFRPKCKYRFKFLEIKFCCFPFILHDFIAAVTLLLDQPS